MSIATVVTELKQQRKLLAQNINTKGVPATENETLAQLIPKVLEISGGGEITQPHIALKAFFTSPFYDTQNITCTVPSEASEGDTILLVLFTRSVVDVPNFTRVLKQDTSSGVQAIEIWQKRVTAEDLNSISYTQSASGRTAYSIIVLKTSGNLVLDNSAVSTSDDPAYVSVEAKTNHSVAIFMGSSRYSYAYAASVYFIGGGWICINHPDSLENNRFWVSLAFVSAGILPVPTIQVLDTHQSECCNATVVFKLA